VVDNEGQGGYMYHQWARVMPPLTWVGQMCPAPHSLDYNGVWGWLQVGAPLEAMAPSPGSKVLSSMEAPKKIRLLQANTVEKNESES
jgi:hypothetical protein